MIEYVLVFLAGLLTAAILWLMLLPAFWRRAVRLTRQDIERHLPLSSNEIAAEQDRLRAQNAVTLGQMQQSLAQMQRDLVAAKAETGERFKAETGFLNTISEGERRAATLVVERDGLLARVAALEEELAAMSEARNLAVTTISGLEMQREALTGKLHAAMDAAETRRMALDDALMQAERLREALAEETQRNALLRNEMQTNQIELRALERRASTLENDVALARIKRGETPAHDSVSPASS